MIRNFQNQNQGFKSKPIASVRGQPLKVVPLKVTAVSTKEELTYSKFPEENSPNFQKSPIANPKVRPTSAPVTRKFIPPVAHSSPFPNSKQNPNSKDNSSHLGTPKRKSFTAVKSSGYGRQNSMNLNTSGIKV